MMEARRDWVAQDIVHLHITRVTFVLGSTQQQFKENVLPCNGHVI